MIITVQMSVGEYDAFRGYQIAQGECDSAWKEKFQKIRDYTDMLCTKITAAIAPDDSGKHFMVRDEGLLDEVVAEAWAWISGL